jgi:hypothetical protein
VVAIGKQSRSDVQISMTKDGLRRHEAVC